jgi:hypothetical protein
VYIAVGATLCAAAAFAIIWRRTAAAAAATATAATVTAGVSIQ